MMKYMLMFAVVTAFVVPSLNAWTLLPDWETVEYSSSTSPGDVDSSTTTIARVDSSSVPLSSAPVHGVGVTLEKPDQNPVEDENAK